VVNGRYLYGYGYEYLEWFRLSNLIHIKNPDFFSGSYCYTIHMSGIPVSQGLPPDQITSENLSNASIVGKLLFRLLLLSAIIFIAITYVPSEPLDNNSKLAITAIVVLIYAVIDIIISLILRAKNTLCYWLCGC
jgi:hypothetical protein